MTAQAYLEQLVDIDRRIKDKLRESSEWRSIAMSKGTGIEEVTKKLEEFLDSCDKEENTITNI